MADYKFTDNSGIVLRALSSNMSRALEAMGIQAEGYAKLELENSPRRIDTGNLRNSISHRAFGDAAYIGTNVEYAPYVHDGTVRMAPNRFLKNAVAKHTDEYKAIAKQYLKG